MSFMFVQDEQPIIELRIGHGYLRQKVVDEKDVLILRQRELVRITKEKLALLMREMQV